MSISTDGLNPVLYRHCGTDGNEVGLIPVNAKMVQREVDEGRATGDFWSRLFYLWENPAQSEGGEAS